MTRPLPTGPLPGKRTLRCPSCGTIVTARPYDIGSGPEMACPVCEWCWGADGQDLLPLVLCHVDVGAGRCVLLAGHDGKHLPFPKGHPSE